MTRNLKEQEVVFQRSLNIFFELDYKAEGRSGKEECSWCAKPFR